MGLFDGILGGVIGAAMTQVVTKVIEQHGGVQGIVAELNKKGLGDAVKSWVSTGPNKAVSPDQIQSALGSDFVAKLARDFGLDPQDLVQKLTQALPQAVDKLTPDGTLPRA